MVKNTANQLAWAAFVWCVLPIFKHLGLLMLMTSACSFLYIIWIMESSSDHFYDNEQSLQQFYNIITAQMNGPKESKFEFVEEAFIREMLLRNAPTSEVGLKSVVSLRYSYLTSQIFYRGFLARSEPLVIEALCEEWNACNHWSNARYLELTFGRNHVRPNFVHSKLFPSDFDEK